MFSTISEEKLMQEFSEMVNLRIVPSGKPVGAEIQGVDLAQPLTDATLQAIRKAVDTYGIVCFREQNLPPDTQINLSKRFGPLQKHVRQEYALPNYPDIHLISNVKEGERSIGSAYAGDDWHTDLCFMREPLRYAVLHAIEVPVDEAGRILGDTLFASTAHAYETLPSELKARVAGLHGIFQYHRAQERKRQQRAKDHPRPELTPEQKAATPDVTHPVVVTHPLTKRKVIYVNQVYTFGLSGISEQDAQPLLNALYSHITREETIYTHKWRNGDVIMWDNWSTQHKAIADYRLPQRRLMHRTAIMGTVPFESATAIEEHSDAHAAI
jgi:taurine dioxygenase